MIPLLKHRKLPYELLKERYESMVPNTTPVEEKYETTDEKNNKVYISRLNTMVDKLDASLEFWTKMKLPDLPCEYKSDELIIHSPKLSVEMEPFSLDEVVRSDG